VKAPALRTPLNRMAAGIGVSLFQTQLSVCLTLLPSISRCIVGEIQIISLSLCFQIHRPLDTFHRD